MAPPPTLYEAVLGPRFAELAPALQTFHAQPAGARASGALAVRRGRGPLARFAAWFIRAPKPGEAVPVELSIELEPADDPSEAPHPERWVRHFAGAPMVTRQWRADTLLVEALSLSRLYFELRVSEGAMVFEQRRCELLGIPLPRALSPRVEARAGPCQPPRADSWALEVRIALPLIGLVCEYAGEMRSEVDDG